MVKLVEMFSAIGAPKADNQDIDWLDDLKFFIDHNHELQVNKIIPAVHKHKEHAENPNAYKLYMIRFIFGLLPLSSIFCIKIICLFSAKRPLA